jgi:hypothetical protein
MAEDQSHPIESPALDIQLQIAAEKLADSMMRGVAAKPLSAFVCALLWVVTAPVQLFVSMLGS